MTNRQGLKRVFVLSLLALFGSLYYSYFGDPFANMMSGELFLRENGFPPCALCWFTRILSYPLVLISGLALWKKDYQMIDYMWPFGVLGILITAYNYYLQKFAGGSSGFCNVLAANGPSCTAIHVDYFGFVTIPLLGFVFFALLCFIAIRTKYQHTYKEKTSDDIIALM